MNDGILLVVLFHTFAAHLSVPDPEAKIRRKLPPESVNIRSFRPPVSEPVSSASLLFNLASSALLHGCHVAPSDCDMHMFDIRFCPTVRSKDINPNNISSAKSKLSRRIQRSLHICLAFLEQWRTVRCCSYPIWSFLVPHIRPSYVSSSTTANWCNNFEYFSSELYIYSIYIHKHECQLRISWRSDLWYLSYKMNDVLNDYGY